MVQIIEQSDIFGKIGKALGGGLGEQIPKEVERSRLAQGLQKIRENAKNGTNPFDAAVQLFTLPGLKPEQAASLMPLFQAELTRAQGLTEKGDRVTGKSERVGGGNTRSIAAEERQKAAQPIIGRQAEVRKDSQTEFPETGLTANIESTNWSPAEKRRRADIKFKENPRLYPTPESAEVAVEKEMASRQNLYNDIKQKSEKYIPEYMQKSGMAQYESIPAEYLDKFYQRAFSDSLTGNLSPDDAARTAAQNALDFSKVRSDFKNVTWWDRQLRGNKKALTQSIPEYEKWGAKELWVADAITAQNLSENMAKKLAYPATKTLTQVSNALRSNPNLNYTILRSSGVDKQQKMLSEVMDRIVPENSLFTVLDELSSAGFNENFVIDYMKNNLDRNELNPTQQRELSTIRPRGMPGLTDLWIEVGRD